MAETVIKALVVDDSALYRKFVRSVLEEIPGVEVLDTASNGRIGLEKIEALRPDLVTLDLEMPELDGLGMLRNLSVRDIDVTTIMISALTAEGAKATNTALQLGAFDFVLKPTGKGPEESREQLKHDLAPKILACTSVLRRKLGLALAARPSASRPPTDAVSRMVRRVSEIRYKPEVVGIGVSTGGPVALNRLLPKFPANFPCPILLVQHMPPLFTKSLADDLNRICPMEVKEASEGMTAEPGQVLIAPGGAQMRVTKLGGRPVVQITNDPPERNCKPAVDYLFRSIAHHYGDRAVAAILTGMGDDGTLGCKLLKRAGATILAQDEQSCVVYGMPRSVVEAGLADHVGPLDDLAEYLKNFVSRGAVA
ncbi:MAG: chemotaxis response regulator protein-glutamate methylesterase [Planctomycetales bacterium]|nr:chemotaxis response regulator protein-glutamate methylesterase [Planctomycetales bacterium]